MQRSFHRQQEESLNVKAGQGALWNGGSQQQGRKSESNPRDDEHSAKPQNNAGQAEGSNPAKSEQAGSESVNDGTDRGTT
jgi:hypothetical protein